MLRVGRKCIVSFPNYAFAPLRRMLAEDGRAPEAPGLLRHRWYNTPNIRFFSIADFQELCAAKGLTIHRLVALNTETRQEIADEPNLNADLAIFVISR
jgi:homoserine O-acetyltransferase